MVMGYLSELGGRLCIVSTLEHVIFVVYTPDTKVKLTVVTINLINSCYFMYTGSGDPIIFGI